uniref:Uncharacterized protein n=1 Tax=viral metagenome TaxID=1070528 RepID=A0A2V0RIK9_9ZZZZ
MCSSLSRGDYLRLTNVIKSASKRWGVAVKLNCLDIIFIDDELVSHPLVRYLNMRNNIIFDKVELFNENLRSGIYSQESVLRLASYSQEEFIPSLTVDTFFTEDINELKHKLKTSIQHKAVKRMMSSSNVHDTEGENFH